MKYIIHITWMYLIFLCMSNVAACPLCVGMPQDGTRPYFERLGIQYIVAHTAQPADQIEKNKPDVQKTKTPESTYERKQNSTN